MPFYVDNCPLHNCLHIAIFAKMDIKTKFGKRVKQVRLEKGFSQEGLANAAEIDRTYISDIEKGERNVSLVIIEKIANALCVKISYLIQD